MKQRLHAPRSQQHLLQKKLASVFTDSEAEDAQPAPAKKVRKRQKAKMRVTAEGESKTVVQAAGAVDASVTGFETKLESEFTAGSIGAGAKAAIRPSFHDQDCLTHTDHVCSVDESNATPNKGSTCDVGTVDKENQSANTVGDCKDGVSGREASYGKVFGNLPEAVEFCKVGRQPEEGCQGSENDESYREEELRLLLGEWPETEDEDTCSELDIGGYWDGSNQAPFEDQPGLERCNTAVTAAEGDDRSGPRARGRRTRRRARARRRKRLAIQDDWMVPFEKLMDDPSCAAWPPAHGTPLLPAVPQHPSLPPAVKISLPPSAIKIPIPSSCKCPANLPTFPHPPDEVFQVRTVSEKVFEPVPSSTGQLLFTDGVQLYAPVCVMVSPPSPTVALAPES